VHLSDIIPATGHVQRIYCDNCNHHLDLAYVDFDEEVSGVGIRIEGLPVLRCPTCAREYLPALSRLAILNLHKEAFEKSAPAVQVRRRKRSNDFGFTKVPFLYDPDDYYYIPGLFRPFNVGFLQPVFFRPRVLLKYDNSPGYRVQFASTTYGQIVTEEDDQISFGINRHGNLVMWLGDIAKLPEVEQHYLRSENVGSDHSIGSEFYDGQIEAVFTELPAKDDLFRLRSEFIESCFIRFGRKIAHLESEVLDLAVAFNPPVIDTPKERRYVADTLNKIYLESLDNKALGEILSSVGCVAKGSGSLKRLQAVLETLAPTQDVGAILSPLFVLYDLRVAYSHLTPQAKTQELLKSIGRRLDIPANADLASIYERLTKEMARSFATLSTLVKPAEPPTEA
jgi:hypothetical protein